MEHCCEHFLWALEGRVQPPPLTRGFFVFGESVQKCSFDSSCFFFWEAKFQGIELQPPFWLQYFVSLDVEILPHVFQPCVLPRLRTIWKIQFAWLYSNGCELQQNQYKMPAGVVAAIVAPSSSLCSHSQRTFLPGCNQVAYEAHWCAGTSCSSW